MFHILGDCRHILIKCLCKKGSFLGFEPQGKEEKNMGLFNECVEERLDSYIDALNDATKKEYKEYQKTNMVSFSLPLNSSKEYQQGYKDGYFVGYQQALQDAKKY